MSNLIERLRRGELAYMSASGPVYKGPTALEAEAADALQAAAEREEKLRTEVTMLKDADRDHLSAKLGMEKRLTDRIKALEEGLRKAIEEAEKESRDLRNDNATRYGAIYAMGLIRRLLEASTSPETDGGRNA